MVMNNKLIEMARELLEISNDIETKIKVSNLCSEQGIKHSVDEFNIHTFEQVWGSTATGFDGWGGSMIVTQNTYVLTPNQYYKGDTAPCYVYFGSRFAYSVNYCQKLMDDIKNECVKSVRDSVEYNI